MGNKVLFNSRTFDHAFSESMDYRFGGGSHDVPFSKKRARCILWIKEVLVASNEGKSIVKTAEGGARSVGY
jgi:hypothetical protein